MQLQISLLLHNPIKSVAVLSLQFPASLLFSLGCLMFGWMGSQPTPTDRQHRDEESVSVSWAMVEKGIWGCHATVAWLFWCWQMPHQTLSHPDASGILSVTRHISQLTQYWERVSGWAALGSVMCFHAVFMGQKMDSNDFFVIMLHCERIILVYYDIDLIFVVLAINYDNIWQVYLGTKSVEKKNRSDGTRNMCIQTMWQLNQIIQTLYLDVNPEVSKMLVITLNRKLSTQSYSKYGR